MRIHFFNECEKNVDEYKKLIRKVLKGYSPNKEFNIIFVNDEFYGKNDFDQYLIKAASHRDLTTCPAQNVALGCRGYV